MSFICKNGAIHRHNSVAESKDCWRSVYRPTVPAVVYGTVYTRDKNRLPRPPGMSTWKQLDYVDDLKGDTAHALTLDKLQVQRLHRSLHPEQEGAARRDSSSRRSRWTSALTCLRA